MTRELKRDGLLVRVSKTPTGVDVTVQMSGNLRLKQVFDDLEMARNQVCGLARGIAFDAKTAGHSKTLSQAAKLFTFMRDVRL